MEKLILNEEKEKLLEGLLIEAIVRVCINELKKENITSEKQ